MINIFVPDDNHSEREYIIQTIFEDFLGLNYSLEFDNNIRNYLIKFSEKEIVIKDSFFALFPGNLLYLTENALPKSVAFSKNEFIIESDIPVLFGSPEISLAENMIFCEIDIFATIFFMLTRWEEYVNKSRDEHDRFPGEESVAYTYQFLHRPIVNEYVEMLWQLIIKCGYSGKRKIKEYELVLTHDIDQLDYPKLYYIIAGDLIKRKQIKLAWRNLSYYFKTGSNPYDTFDFIMSVSERLGLQSHFYFMSSDSEIPPDNKQYIFNKRFAKKLKEVKDRGHIIGFHPGYFTYQDPKRWNYEKELLESATQSKILEGRQHFLRFNVPETFRIWEQNNMKMDSSMGYARHTGFRCGTGDIFKVFDFLERKELNIKEQPLIIMDGSLSEFSIENSVKLIKKYVDVSKKYHSRLTLLFHNTTFYGESWKGYDDLYLNALGIDK